MILSTFPFLGDKNCQQRDPTQATTTVTKANKKKYTVFAAVMLSGVGLTVGFSVAHYNTSSSGGDGSVNGDGGVSIQASVDTVPDIVDDDDFVGGSSSRDLPSGSDNTSLPATGTWGGKSFQSGDTHFEKPATEIFIPKKNVGPNPSTPMIVVPGKNVSPRITQVTPRVSFTLDIF